MDAYIVFARQVDAIAILMDTVHELIMSKKRGFCQVGLQAQD